MGGLAGIEASKFESGKMRGSHYKGGPTKNDNDVTERSRWSTSKIKTMQGTLGG